MNINSQALGQLVQTVVQGKVGNSEAKDDALNDKEKNLLKELQEIISGKGYTHSLECGKHLLISFRWFRQAVRYIEGQARHTAFNTNGHHIQSVTLESSW